MLYRTMNNGVVVIEREAQLAYAMRRRTYVCNGMWIVREWVYDLHTDAHYYVDYALATSLKQVNQLLDRFGRTWVPERSMNVLVPMQIRVAIMDVIEQGWVAVVVDEVQVISPYVYRVWAQCGFDVFQLVCDLSGISE